MADPLQQTVVASVLAGDPRLGPLATLTERLGLLDLSTLLVYLVDLTSADLLPVLAEQMHVMGDEGWLLANTDDQRRTLIKRAVELHRYKGTVWAVKEVFGVLAVDVELVEWWQQQPAAAPYTFALTAWVNNNLLPGAPVLTAGLYERLQRMVDMVKPVRSAYSVRIGSRFDGGLRFANGANLRSVLRGSAETSPVQPRVLTQQLPLANAANLRAVTHRRAEAQPVAIVAGTTLSCAGAFRARAIIHIAMEAL